MAEPEPEPEPEPGPHYQPVCYHCGETGHVRLDCPNPENPAAVVALKEFRTARKQRRKQQQRQSEQPPKPRECARIARAWLAERSAADECGGDPVALAVSCGTKQLQRDLAAAAKAHFDRGIEHIAAELARGAAAGTASSAREADSAGEALASALRGALRDGVPPDFGDAAALTAYTQERLQARCRYLYTLLLCEDEVCSAARQQLLLPQPADGASCGTTQRPLSVLSIGGGPAFDDVALRLLASFLASMPCGKTREHARPVQICTVVLDLNEAEWTTAARAVAAATDSATAAGLLGGGGAEAEQLRLARCDVRLALDDSDNEAMASLTPTADVFVFSFVLHENAAGLLESESADGSDSAATEQQDQAGVEEQDAVPPRIGGCLTGLFSTARVGAFIVMMDASHRLWPSVVSAAAPLGWRASIPTRVRGPFTAARAAKHTLILQRTATAQAPAAGQAVQAQLDVFARHLSAHSSGSGSEGAQGAGSTGFVTQPLH